jgi:hypothetical protein
MKRRTFNLWAGLSGLDLLSRRFALGSMIGQNDHGTAIPANTKQETRSGYMLVTSYYPDRAHGRVCMGDIRAGEGKFTFDWMDHAKAMFRAVASL